MNIEGLQEKQKQIVEEYNQLTFQMQQNQNNMA